MDWKSCDICHLLIKRGKDNPIVIKMNDAIFDFDLCDSCLGIFQTKISYLLDDYGSRYKIKEKQNGKP